MAHTDVAGGVPSGQAVTEGRWIVFEDESGAALTGVVRRTWGQRGVTPVIKLNGARGGRENISVSAVNSCALLYVNDLVWPVDPYLTDDTSSRLSYEYVSCVPVAASFSDDSRPAES